MADNLDLTLPLTAPAGYVSQVPEKDGVPAAIYTLVSLTEGELQEVVRTCQPVYDFEVPESVRLAPEPYFVSQPLRAVFDSHLQLGTQGEYDHMYFIVVVNKNWKESGVLLVTMENNDEPPAVDSFFIKPKYAGAAASDLQIANTDWDECRDSYEVGVESEGEEDGGGTDKEEKAEAPTDAADGQSDDEGPDYPSRKPAYDYLIPIYTLDSVDANTLITSLEEDVHEKPNPFTDYRIRNQGNLKPANQNNKNVEDLSKPDSVVTEDLVAQACALHPIRCRANKWLNKTYFLLCDNTRPSQSGVVMVKIAWDSVTKGRSKAELREIGRSASYETTRLGGTCENAVKYGYKFTAEDVSIFSRTHPAFGIFQLNADSPHHEAKLVDPQHWDRKQRDEYLIVAGTPYEVHRSSTAEVIEMRWTLEESVNRFPWFCYWNRFEPLFNRQYFLWFDHERVRDEGAVLVRYDWDMDLERSESELWDLKVLDAVRTIRIPTDEAMTKILTAANDGSDNWAWETYEE